MAGILRYGEFLADATHFFDTLTFFFRRNCPYKSFAAGALRDLHAHRRKLPGRKGYFFKFALRSCGIRQAHDLFNSRHLKL